MRVPIELEDAVRGATAAVLGDAVLATGALARAIVDRSQRYTSERDRLAKPPDADADLAARAAFFTIADAMKIGVPIAELAARDAMPARRPLRVVDLGAGCGAMTLGLLCSVDGARAARVDALAAPRGDSRTAPPADAFAARVDALAAPRGDSWTAPPADAFAAPHAKLDVTRELDPGAFDVIAIDRDARALSIAERAIRELAAALGRQIKLATRPGDVTRADLPAADLVVLGSVLNELPPDAALSLVEKALAAIADDGAVIIIEPALRDTTRALHEIRDALIDRKAAHVFAPCTRRCTPCTALPDPDAWCHEDRSLDLPPQTATLARLTHLRDTGMKFSYLVLRKQPLDLVDAGPTAWRAVSAPRVAKGKHEITGCSQRGRVTLRLMKRNRVDGNRELERADRGDVLAIDTPPGDQRLELTASSAVTRIRRP